MIRGIYFSATGTTKRVVETLSKTLSGMRGDKVIQFYDFTTPKSRLLLPEFFEKMIEEVEETDLLLIGVPVYAGRVPNILLKTFNELRVISKDKKAYVVPIVLYGNRHYDAALNELGLILHEKGFSLLGAAAFIGEHSFSNELAKGRPDEQDIIVMKQFSEALYEVQRAQTSNKEEETDRIFLNQSILDKLGGAYTHEVLKPYYRPQNTNGDAFDFRPIKPVTTDACIQCGVCSEACPMGSIEKENPKIISGICIKCCACVKKCPVQAKFFTDQQFLFHKTELEEALKKPKAASLFFAERE